jgi:hypothetical protein
MLEGVKPQGFLQSMAIEVGTSIPSARLMRVLSRLVDCYGAPDAIRLDKAITDADTAGQKHRRLSNLDILLYYL